MDKPGDRSQVEGPWGRLRGSRDAFMTLEEMLAHRPPGLLVAGEQGREAVREVLAPPTRSQGQHTRAVMDEARAELDQLRCVQALEPGEQAIRGWRGHGPERSDLP